MSYAQPLLAHDELTLDIAGEAVAFPILPDQEIATSPLEPFSAAIVAGDPALVSDDRIGGQYWSDMRVGIGLKNYNEAESLSGCADSDLDTRFEGYFMLPPLKEALAAGVPAAWLPTDRGVRVDQVGTTYIMWWNGSTGCYTWNGATWDLRLSGQTVRAFAFYRGVYVVATAAGIYTSPDGTTWTLRWVGVLVALATHDNKLYGMAAPVDQATYFCQDPTSATAWNLQAGGGKSAEALYLEPGEVVVKGLEWRNRANVKAVCWLTNRRVMFYDDDDFYGEYARLRANCTYPDAMVKLSDDNLYVTMYPNDFVMRYGGDTYDNISPNKRGGIPKDERFAISHFADSLHWFYAFATTRPGRTYPGRTLVMSMTDNWHNLNRGKRDVAGAVTRRVVGGGYILDSLLTVFSDGSVERQRVPDNNDLPFMQDDAQYEPGPLYLTSAESDAGLVDIDKLQKWWRIDVVDQDNRPGIPPGGQLLFDWQLDGSGIWMSQPILNPTTGHPVGLLLMQTLDNNVQSFPVVLPQPSFDDQRGVRWNRMQWRVGLARSGVGTTPVIRVISGHYRRIPPIYDGFQVTVDLSVDTFGRFPGQTFGGRDRDTLRAIIESIKQGDVDYQLTYGHKGFARTIKAVDLRISSREDVETGFGVHTFTLRDTTAPKR